MSGDAFELTSIVEEFRQAVEARDEAAVDNTNDKRICFWKGGRAQSSFGIFQFGGV